MALACRAIACGGITAPVLLMAGRGCMPATGASLLLNAVAVFTALIALIAFQENADRRVGIGMVAIVAGSCRAHLARGKPSSRGCGRPCQS